MSAARYFIVLALALAFATPAAASFENGRTVSAAAANATRSLAGATPGAPQDLHGFLLRENDRRKVTHTFPRTPAFAWSHVEGARQYEFQLSTSRNFADNAVVWSSKPRAAVATVPITLPWVTGAKYSWFARVRALVNGEPSAWSKTFGFNLRPPGSPKNLVPGLNPTPGMVRWTPVRGATAYDVVFLYDQGQAKSKRIRTATTAADLRELYTFHNRYPSTQPVFWRVRAVREVVGKTKNALPSVSYGPWSARFRTIEPSFNTGTLVPLASISRAGKTDVLSASPTGAPGKGPHGLVPGFSFTGATGPFGEAFGECSIIEQLFGVTCPLYHVYVFTDNTCSNRVHVSDLVGSPAYVPRLTPPLSLPSDGKGLAAAGGLFLDDGTEGTDVYTAGDDLITASGMPDGSGADESAATSGASDDADAEPTESTDTGASSEAATRGDASRKAIRTSSGTFEPRRNGLWDVDWPSARYVWTVVPAVPQIVPDDPANPTEGKVIYKDVVFPEDMCAQGHGFGFGKTSEVVTTAESGVPFVSGLSPAGKVVSAQGAVPSFFQRVVVAWKPAVGATKYEVQFSRKKNAWKTLKRKFTPGTQLQVQLSSGKWFYRVRGLDLTLPGNPGLSWSEPVELKMVAPTFSIVTRS